MSAYHGGDANALNPLQFIAELEALVGADEPMPIKYALATVGLAPTTYYTWMAKGENGDPRYTEFYTRMTAAKQRYALHLLKDISRSRDYKAKIWLLETLDPETFARDKVVNVVHHEGIPRHAEVIDVEAELIRRNEED